MSLINNAHDTPRETQCKRLKSVYYIIIASFI